MPATLWDLQEAQVTRNTRTWVRSYKQEIETGLGGDWQITCHLERVTVDMDTREVRSHEILSPVTRLLSRVGSDSTVVNLQTLLTTLVQNWRIEDSQP